MKIVFILTQTSLKVIPKGSINNIPALGQIMAWFWSGYKPLFELVVVQFNDTYIDMSASMS